MPTTLIGTCVTLCALPPPALALSSSPHVHICYWIYVKLRIECWKCCRVQHLFAVSFLGLLLYVMEDIHLFIDECGNCVGDVHLHDYAVSSCCKLNIFNQIFD